MQANDTIRVQRGLFISSPFQGCGFLAMTLLTFHAADHPQGLITFLNGEADEGYQKLISQGQLNGSFQITIYNWEILSSISCPMKSN